MSLFGWNTLLFALKWVFIGMVYLSLFVVLFAVRREMSLRLRRAPRHAAAAPGRLKVTNPGQDTVVQLGDLLPLLHDTSLGSQQDNDLVLRDPFISGHHARLRWDGAFWWIEDLGSRNGTLLNGRQIPPMQPQMASLGATIGLGDMVFELLE
jgi:hypothetical protein